MPVFLASLIFLYCRCCLLTAQSVSVRILVQCGSLTLRFRSKTLIRNLRTARKVRLVYR